MDNESDKPIGVFDSGVGGLSILIELKKLLPKENFVYLADQAYIPYGEKGKQELIDRCSSVADYFIENHKIKIMVVACNTATANAIQALRKKYFFPIIGTIPGVKPAAEKTKSKTIAVLSTPSTSRSYALKKLIKDNCQGTSVLNIGCKDLVGVVEEGSLDGLKVDTLLKKYLERIKSSNADYLVLGCTHYPFLGGAITGILGSKVKLVDSGKAIAVRTKSLLQKNKILNKSKGRDTYLTTGSPVKFSKVASKLLKKKIKGFGVAI